MAIEKALCTILNGAQAVTDIIGTSIYPLVMSADVVLPAIVYQQISGQRDQVMAGPSGLASPRFQITCWADTYKKADELADAVRQTLDGYSGIVESVVIQAIHLLDEADMPGIRPDNKAQSRYGKRLDFQIWHKE